MLLMHANLGLNIIIVGNRTVIYSVSQTYSVGGKNYNFFLASDQFFLNRKEYLKITEFASKNFYQYVTVT